MEVGTGFGGGFSGFETGQQAVTAADPSVFAIVHPIMLHEKFAILAGFVVCHMYHLKHILHLIRSKANTPDWMYDIFYKR